MATFERRCSYESFAYLESVIQSIMVQSQVLRLQVSNFRFQNIMYLTQGGQGMLINVNRLEVCTEQSKLKILDKERNNSRENYVDII